MKNKMLLGAVLVGTLSMGQAFAAADSLQNATITATYNGLASEVWGFSQGFLDVPGSNISSLDLTNNADGGAEFFTSDFLFGIDFTKAGAVSFLSAYDIPTGAYSMTFDFGSTLDESISAFTIDSADGIGATPVLSVLNDHSVSFSVNVDEAHAWNNNLVLSTHLSFTPAVPEPMTPFMLLAGLGVLGLSCRFSKK
jgi:hypothetical protein